MHDHAAYMRKRRAGEKTAQDNGLSHFLNELEWKPIPDFPGYEASVCGQIKSCARKMIRSNGRKHQVPERVLKQNPDGKGYAMVHPYIEGKRLPRNVHKLVYLAWGGSVPRGYEVDHIDGNHLNNHIENLQAMSHEEHVRKTLQQMKDQAYEAGYQQAVKDLSKH